MFYIFFSLPWIQCTEECLFQNQVVFTFMSKEISTYYIDIGRDAELHLSVFNGSCRNIKQCNIHKSIFDEIFSFIGITTTRNKESGIFILVLIHIFYK